MTLSKVVRSQITKWLPDHEKRPEWAKNAQNCPQNTYHVQLCQGTRQLLHGEPTNLLSIHDPSKVKLLRLKRGFLDHKVALRSDPEDVASTVNQFIFTKRT